jgi:ribonucleotide reductase alpha subunit
LALPVAETPYGGGHPAPIGALMVVLDVDHPEIEEFVNTKPGSAGR